MYFFTQMQYAKENKTIKYKKYIFNINTIIIHKSDSINILLQYKREIERERNMY